MLREVLKRVSEMSPEHQDDAASVLLALIEHDAWPAWLNADLYEADA